MVGYCSASSAGSFTSAFELATTAAGVESAWSSRSSAGELGAAPMHSDIAAKPTPSFVSKFWKPTRSIIIVLRFRFQIYCHPLTVAGGVMLSGIMGHSHRLDRAPMTSGLL